MSRWIAAVLCMTGCASQMHTLHSGWDGSTEPDCTESEGAVLGDALAGRAGLEIAEATADSHRGLSFLSLLAGAGFAASAAIGEQEAIPDLSACTLVETATCFAGTCYPSGDACAAHRGPDSIGDCTERR
jgi:hypothetical protein